MEAGVLSPLRAGPGNAIRVSPARAGRSPADRQVREGQRPAPDPAGAKRPPRAGRALAGGCGPPAGKDQRNALAGATAPAMEAVRVRSSVRAGNGNAARFPRPRGTVPRRPAGPGRTEASARLGGGEAPAGGGAGAGRGALAPGWARISVPLRQGRWPLPGCARRAPAQVFPALRSASPCDRDVFSSPPGVPRTILELAIGTGQRIGDLLRMR